MIVRTGGAILVRALFYLMAASLAPAATIVSVTGAVSFSGSVGFDQAMTAGFSTSAPYSNVVISALISGPAAQTFNAYLTTSIGPGTTVADEVASVTTNFPGFNPGTLTPIFNGLNLAANTYHLTIFNPATTSGAWSSTSAPTIVTAPGSSHVFSGYFITNGNALPYPPAASFADLSSQGYTLLYTVAEVQIPEPRFLCVGLLIVVAATGYRHSSHCS